MSEVVDRLIGLFAEPQKLREYSHQEQDELLQCADRAGALWTFLDHVDIQADDSRFSERLAQAANRQAEIESIRDRMVDTLGFAIPEGASPILMQARPWNILGTYHVMVQLLAEPDKRFQIEESLISQGYFEKFEVRKRNRHCEQMFVHKEHPVHVYLMTDLPCFYARQHVELPKLFAAAEEHESYGKLRSLSKEDRVLTRCLEIFYQTRFSARVGDIVDLGTELREYAREEGFWVRLVGRAQDLSVMRALYFGLFSVRSMLNFGIPEEVKRFLEIAAPIQPVRFVVEYSMRKVFLASCEQRKGIVAKAGKRLLRTRACMVNKCWSKQKEEQVSLV